MEEKKAKRTRNDYTKVEALFLQDCLNKGMKPSQAADALREEGISPGERTTPSVEYYIRRVLKDVDDVEAFFAEKEKAAAAKALAKEEKAAAKEVKVSSTTTEETVQQSQ